MLFLSLRYIYYVSIPIPTYYSLFLCCYTIVVISPSCPRILIVSHSLCQVCHKLRGERTSKSTAELLFCFCSFCSDQTKERMNNLDGSRVNAVYSCPLVPHQLTPCPPSSSFLTTSCVGIPTVNTHGAN